MRLALGESTSPSIAGAKKGYAPQFHVAIFDNIVMPLALSSHLPEIVAFL
jgi:hypothetical protein